MSARPPRVLRFPLRLALVTLIFIPPLAFAIMNWSEARQRHKTLTHTARAVLIEHKCYHCHTIGSKPGVGQTDLALAAKMDESTLRSWMLTPAAMKPRTIMPGNQLNTDEVSAVVAFIQSLRGLRKAIQLVNDSRRPSSHRVNGYVLHHGQDTLRNPRDCFRVGCHVTSRRQPDQQFCQACHRDRLPNSHLPNADDEAGSRSNWMKQHGGATLAAWLAEQTKGHPDAKPSLRPFHDRVCWRKDADAPVYANPQFCQTCHEPQQDCASCHQRKSHRWNEWIKGTYQSPPAEAKLAGYRRPLSLHAREAMRIDARCSDCHTDLNRDCDSCHQTPMPHPDKWRGAAHQQAALQNPGMCAICHNSTPSAVARDRPAAQTVRFIPPTQPPTSDCDECHHAPGFRPQAPKTVAHTPDWLQRHAKASQRHEQECIVCHVPQRSGVRGDCFGCHQTEMPHPKDWILKGHAENLKCERGAKFKSDWFCWQCHTASSCDKCHDSERRQGLQPRYAGYKPSKFALEFQRLFR